MEIISGQIVSAEPGWITIRARYDNPERFVRRQYEEVQVGLEDGRRISPEQRRKIYALIGEIAEWAGYEPEEMKNVIKFEFTQKVLKSLERHMFSLSDCDMTTASEFISYLIDFILRNDVPVHVPLMELADDIDKYIYSCLIRKKCCICGKKADLHHVDAIGMGNNRNEVEHVGRRCLPLCREHHMEIHLRGTDAFLNRYHLKTAVIDDKIAKVYKLKSNKI